MLEADLGPRSKWISVKEPEWEVRVIYGTVGNIEVVMVDSKSFMNWSCE